MHFIHPGFRRLPLATLMLAATTSMAQADVSISSEYQSARLVTVAEGFSNPWAVGFLPDERYLVTERSGSIYLVESDGEKIELSGGPEANVAGQGGMLDIVVHPDYEDNGWIYMTYSHGDSNSTAPALVRARLDGHQFVDMEQVFISNTMTGPGRHYGSRILFKNDGTLLMSIGDRGAEPPRAQDTMDHSGTLVRLHHDGSVPDDNPFVGNNDYAPEIYSYGHRNIQGITLHPITGTIWATEHGPRGGDELNRIVAGKNYGWPTATLGREYSTGDQFPDAETRHRDDMEDPVFELLPTQAPSGLAAVNSAHFPNWEGNLLSGGLRGERVMRLVLENEVVVHAEELLHGEIGRIRDVRQGPNGYLYVVNDESDAALYRIMPD